MNRIHTKKDRIVEGELRCELLSQHLERSNLGSNGTKSVFLSEDGSGIVQKIVYDSHSKQLIGLVLPLNERSGMPMICSFRADSAESIQKHIEEIQQSTLVYIVVAQPLNGRAPSFILQIYGIDNKFEAGSVLKRWIHTENELQK